jgi:hypothetical protein
VHGSFCDLDAEVGEGGFGGREGGAGTEVVGVRGGLVEVLGYSVGGWWEGDVEVR